MRVAAGLAVRGVGGVQGDFGLVGLSAYVNAGVVAAFDVWMTFPSSSSTGTTSPPTVVRRLSACSKVAKTNAGCWASCG